MEREAFGVSVSAAAGAFQAFGFFPVELGLFAAWAATGIAIAQRFGVKWRTDRLTLALCLVSFVLLAVGAVLGPAGGFLTAEGTQETHRGALLFVGVGLAGLMVLGAWQRVREAS